MRTLICTLLLGAIMPFFGVIGAGAQTLPDGLGNLSIIKDNMKNKRISSTDPLGYNTDWVADIKPGQTKEIVNIKGAGVINHIWITIAPLEIMRNDIIIRMYWDGNKFPSVEAPIGAFFGNGWDERYNFKSLPLVCGPQTGTGLVSYFNMPFANGARIEIENQSNVNIEKFYFYVDYVSMPKLPADLGRFHAWYNHELTDALPEGETEWGLVGAPGCNVDGAGNYVFADIKGKGHFVGINYYIHSPSPMWYGEGDDMFFIDGEKRPSILGTGTEDFFNTSWCPASVFYHPYYGYPRVNRDNGWLGRTHAYRFMITDPIFFDTAFKGTMEHGHNNNLTLDLASVAYWYQSVAAPLPPAPTKVDRAPKPFIGINELHRWRHEWRKNMGDSPQVWGNEKKNETK